MTMIQARSLIEGDREWAVRLVEKRWGSRMIVSRGRVHDAGELPGFVAMRDGEPVGLATYCVDGDECDLEMTIAAPALAYPNFRSQCK